MKRKTLGVIVVVVLSLFLISAVPAFAIEYGWPTDDQQVTQNFKLDTTKEQYKHWGIDIGVTDKTVYASADGTVTEVYEGCTNYSGLKNTITCKSRGGCTPTDGYYKNGYCNYSFGNGVIIKHSDGSYSSYAHMSTISVSEGDYVKKGQPIGVSGSSGYSGGPHLHFTILRASKLTYWGACNRTYVVDPLPLINNKEASDDNDKKSGSTKEDISIHIVTTSVDDITKTSAILRGSFTVSGARATECGMYFGMSESNMSILGADKVNTNCTGMYYSTAKYGKTLNPGTTYYYQAYVKVGKTTYKGEVKKFTTNPSESFSITLDRSRLTLPYDTCGYLTASTTPAKLSVTWKSSDSSVVTVKNGVVSTVGTGTADIIAEVACNGETATAICSVTVTSGVVSVTTKGVDSITQTSAIIRGNVSVSGGKATECGMYLGTSSNNLSFLGSDSINSSDMPFYYSTSKYGRTLTPNTDYYYRAYAVVNGTTYWGEIKSFTTTKKNDPPTVSVTTKGADAVTRSSAIVRGNVSASNGKASECGMYFGHSESDLSYLGSDNINSSDMSFYYSTSKYGRTLTAGTTYYYQAYAVVNGTTYWGKIKSFTTEIDNPLSISVTTKGADSITQTSAIVRGNVSVSDGKATECGMYLGTSSSNLSFLGSDSINSSDMPFYYSTSKYGRTLMPGTTYYYRAYAVVDGATYWGDPNAFTTEASSPVSNMRTAIVVNTNGSYLAINDRAAASPKYSNQIGRIPPAGVVTVYPDKTNGNWYYVEYNGVSGYAYGKYLSLQ